MSHGLLLSAIPSQNSMYMLEILLNYFMEKHSGCQEESEQDHLKAVRSQAAADGARPAARVTVPGP